MSELADCSLGFGEDQRAHEVFERVSIADAGEDRLKHRENLLEPRWRTSNAEHSVRTSGPHREPLFDVTGCRSLTGQRA